jgi:nucleotide-binding universal stress UspA family protein
VQKAEHHENPKNRHILIAVDESENAKRAVQYVADLLGGTPGFRVVLVAIIPEPTEDFLAADENRQDWIRKYRSRVLAVLEDCRQLLFDAGFEEREELLFGSTSNKILHEAKDCAVWVIE